MKTARVRLLTAKNHDLLKITAAIGRAAAG
jgi:hypothetical protein